MAKVLTDQANYTNIANAIRSKNGKTDKYTPAQMPDAIKAITAGTTVDNTALAGLLDGSLKNLTVPDSVTSIRTKAFDGMSGLTLNINTTYNGITGQPWGATTPTINWLKATKAKVTITQTEHQTITVLDDTGKAFTDSFEAYVGATCKAKVVADSGYTAGTLNITPAPTSTVDDWGASPNDSSYTPFTVTGATTVTATAATESHLQVQPWTINRDNCNTDGAFGIQVGDGTIYPLYRFKPNDGTKNKGIFLITSETSFAAGGLNTDIAGFISGYQGNMTREAFNGPIKNYIYSCSMKLSLKSDSTVYVLYTSPINVDAYDNYGFALWRPSSASVATGKNIDDVANEIVTKFNAGEDVVMEFVNSGGGGQ